MVQVLSQFVIVQLKHYNFPQEAYINVPGGLDFGHPAVQGQMSCLVGEDGRVVFGWEDLFGLQRQRGLATVGDVSALDPAQLGTPISYNELDADQRENIQTVRMGMVPQMSEAVRRMGAVISKGLTFQ